MGTIGLIIGYVLCLHHASKVTLAIIILSYELLAQIALRTIENRRKNG